MPTEVKFKRERCRCGGPLYDQCVNCLEDLCAECYMLRTCREDGSGHRLKIPIRHQGTRPDLQYMTFERFHNALRVLCNIDRDEFEEAIGYTEEYLRGSGKTLDDHWVQFQPNPWAWLIRADDQGAHGVFNIILERSSK